MNGNTTRKMRNSIDHRVLHRFSFKCTRRRLSAGQNNARFGHFPARQNGVNVLTSFCWELEMANFAFLFPAEGREG